MKTWYVEVQDLDYDDYPVGTATKIGPFDSKEHAENFLEKSSRFTKTTIVVGYQEWKAIGRFGSHSVRIKNLLNTPMTDPERYM